MNPIRTRADLQGAITALQLRQKEDEAVLRARMQGGVEAVKPANIIRSTISDLTSASGIKEQMITAIVGLGAGWIAKKLIQWQADDSFFGKLLGLLAQYGISAAIASNPDLVKMISEKIHDALADVEQALHSVNIGGGNDGAPETNIQTGTKEDLSQTPS